MVEQIVGTISRVIWINDNGDWAILKLQSGVTTKGPIPAEGIKMNGEYIFVGQWVEHVNYGRQFHHTSLTFKMPASAEGIALYLKKHIDGVGQTTADKLVEAYREETLTQITQVPAEVAERTGVSRELIDRIKEHVQQNELGTLTEVHLASLLDGYGFRRSVYDAARQQWGVNAAYHIRRNPYALMRFPYAGFTRVDKLYCDLYRDCPQRIDGNKRWAMAAWHALVSDTSGHVWFQISQIIKAMQEIPGSQRLTSERVERVLRILERAGWITRRHDNPELVAETSRALTESLLCSTLWELSLRDIRPHFDLYQGSLTDHQYICAGRALSRSVGILAGKPGTGKTFTLAEIVRQALDIGYDVAVCAPTGKAAVRCTEALGGQLTATTIHTLLAPRMVPGKGLQFTYGRDNRLPCELLIVDESSMLDCALALDLMQAISPTCRVLFVGDPYQLAPVGYGQPLLDMIRSKTIPVGELTEIHRHSGNIVIGCSDIANGRVPTCFTKKFNPENRRDNLILVADSNADNLRLKFTNCLQAMLQQGYNPDDIQTIVPTNNSGLLGRKEMNGLIKGYFNPGALAFKGARFSAGDRVIFLKNGMRKGYLGQYQEGIEDEDMDDEVYVANGDIGRIARIRRAGYVISLPTPDRVVFTGRVGTKKTDPLAGKKDDDDVFMDLAYSITGHKSQGSGYPYVLVMIDPAFAAKGVMSRQWLYTAISRAEICSVVFGDPEVIRQVVGKQANLRRTYLAQDLSALKGVAHGQEAKSQTDVLAVTF